MSKNATFEYTELASESIDCGGTQLLDLISALWFCGTERLVYCTKTNRMWYKTKKNRNTKTNRPVRITYKMSACSHETECPSDKCYSRRNIQWVFHLLKYKQGL